jgi:hypothetical protein
MARAHSLTAAQTPPQLQLAGERCYKASWQFMVHSKFVNASQHCMQHMLRYVRM